MLTHAKPLPLTWSQANGFCLVMPACVTVCKTQKSQLQSHLELRLPSFRRRFANTMSRGGLPDEKLKLMAGFGIGEMPGRQMNISEKKYIYEVRSLKPVNMALSIALDGYDPLLAKYSQMLRNIRSLDRSQAGKVLKKTHDSCNVQFGPIQDLNNRDPHWTCQYLKQFCLMSQDNRIKKRTFRLIH